MIKCKGGIVEIDGKTVDVVSELATLIAGLRKAGIPSEIIAHSIGIGIALGESDDEESYEAEETKALDGVKDAFRSMTDGAKEAIVKAMREVMEEND